MSKSTSAMSKSTYAKTKIELLRFSAPEHTQNHQNPLRNSNVMCIWIKFKNPRKQRPKFKRGASHLQNATGIIKIHSETRKLQAFQIYPKKAFICVQFLTNSYWKPIPTFWMHSIDLVNALHRQDMANLNTR